MSIDPNRRIALIVLATVAGMVGLSYAAVPLYRAFCQVTGWGGTTQQTEVLSDEVLERQVTVRFDATTAADLPWTFKPEQLEQSSHIGEAKLAFYEATNNSDRPIVGTASFNVQPAKAGIYFMKVECFCFTEQVLQPGESVRMPITYYVDPEMDDNPRLDEVREITLSYTFYRNLVAEERMASNGS
jgi:cytochrome c oxidase assembly protein subunit 11